MAAEFFDTVAQRKTTHDTSLLGYAAQFKLQDLVTLLLETPGIYEEEASMSGSRHALCIAAHFANMEAFNSIMEHSANKRATSASSRFDILNLFGHNDNANHVLLMAVKSQSLAMVKRVLQIDTACINAVAPYRHTLYHSRLSALCEAVRKPNTGIVQLLLENGATVHNNNVNVHDSALCLARDSPKHIALLARYGADLWGAEARAAIYDYVFADADASLTMFRMLRNQQLLDLAFAVAVGLAQFDLPVLVTINVFDQLLPCGAETHFNMHKKWKVLQICKDRAKQLCATLQNGL